MPVVVVSSRWAKKLFSRMNFVKRRKRSSKVDITDEARKEIEFLYLHDIVSEIEKYDISSALVVNIDQALLKYIPVGNETKAATGEHSVTNEGSADKRSTTGTFAISFDGNFLPVQLIYGGRQHKVYRGLNFQKISASAQIPNIFQTWTDESLKFLKEVINPYVIKQRQILKCSADQQALVIMGRL